MPKLGVKEKMAYFESPILWFGESVRIFVSLLHFLVLVLVLLLDGLEIFGLYFLSSPLIHRRVPARYIERKCPFLLFNHDRLHKRI